MAGWWRRDTGQDPERIERTLAEFESLVNQYQRPMTRVAYRLAGNHDDAQDLLQDALYEAYRNFDRFEHGSRFDRWIYRIMTNRHIDRVRRRQKVQFLSLDQADDDGDEGWQLEDRAADPAEVLVADLLDETLQRALMELPDEYRVAVILVDLEGMTYDEVARIAGCPIGTVRSRLHRGRYLLRDKLTAATGKATGAAESVTALSTVRRQPGNFSAAESAQADDVPPAERRAGDPRA